MVRERVICESRVDPRGERQPVTVERAGERLGVLGIDDQWYGVDADYWRVRLSDGSRALLCRDRADDVWYLLQHLLLDA